MHCRAENSGGYAAFGIQKPFATIPIELTTAIAIKAGRAGRLI
ncbi:MAG: hypothetical protein ACLS48_05450 [[Eubacterium] siraeum]